MLQCGSSGRSLGGDSMPGWNLKAGMLAEEKVSEMSIGPYLTLCFLMPAERQIHINLA